MTIHNINNVKSTLWLKTSVMENYIIIIYSVLSQLLHAYVSTLLSLLMHIMCDLTGCPLVNCLMAVSSWRLSTRFTRCRSPHIWATGNHCLLQSYLLGVYVVLHCHTNTLYLYTHTHTHRILTHIHHLYLHKGASCFFVLSVFTCRHAVRSVWPCLKNKDALKRLLCSVLFISEVKVKFPSHRLRRTIPAN